MHAAATAELNVTSATASGALGRDLGGHSAGYELADKLASAFFLDCMDNSGNVPVLSDGARRKKECEGVLSALKAMANRDEMAVLTLKERDQSSQAHAVSIAGEVVILLVRRLLREYADYMQTRVMTRPRAALPPAKSSSTPWISISSPASSTSAAERSLHGAWTLRQ